jgi:hypothetical protein
MQYPRLAALLAVIAANGCSPYDPDLGAEPFLCGTDEPRCPDGYVCVTRVGEQVCERDAVVGDAGGDGNLLCSGDTNEPNETIESSTTTPAPMTNAVICPASDIDIFQLDAATTGMNVRVEVGYESARGELVVDLLNSTGISVRTATRVNNDPNKLRADFENVAEGTYYGRVKGTGALNNYSVTLIVTSNALPQ